MLLPRNAHPSDCHSTYRKGNPGQIPWLAEKLRGQIQGCSLQSKEPEGETRKRDEVWGARDESTLRGPKDKNLRKELGGRKISLGRMDFGNAFLSCHVIHIPLPFIVKYLKPEVRFHDTYSSIARNVVDWLQVWINILQIPVKSVTFQFLPECHSGRNVSKIDSRVL